MWPSVPGVPESGTRVALLDREGGQTLAHGLSDELGQYRGQLPKSWVGKSVVLVVREPGFKYDHFNPVSVERWGLFLAIRQEKDLAYSGDTGAKAINPEKWERWNSTQEYINASKVIAAATRQAKIAWPIREFGLAIAVVSGVAGFFVSPAAGLIIGLATFGMMELLSLVLFRRGY
jgi:hypothetical protein